ncbi:MAG: disulfide bond formation protein B [Gammaproteobacteria bacterium]|nr:disulfide bond formation protein B [Gammaproteobacteria bacterium]
MITKANIESIIDKVEFIDSIIGIAGVLIIISAALFVQFFLHELPCPLCELQRAAFISIGIGLLMNVRYGNKASHWGVVILSACAGIAVSIRQILLHISSPVGFGSTMLGLHMYSWCFIGFALAIVGSAVMLIIYPEKKNQTPV